MSRGGLVCALAAAVLVLAGSAGATSRARAAVAIGVYPSATSVRAAAAVPGTPASSVSLATAIGGRDDATVVVTGASRVGVTASSLDAPLKLSLFFAQYVSFGGTLVPDALEPWDGSPRAAEQRNQPLWLQVTAPAGTPPGTYGGSLDVVADGAEQTIPISVRVFPVSLPAPNQVSGSLLTAFHLAAQSYGNKVNALYGESAQNVLPGLYRFIASYRLSPSSWGYGTPRSTAGYTTDKRWWLDAADQMTQMVGDRDFAAMAIPISNNRTAPHNYIAGLAPDRPQAWCSYLQAVHGFWQQHGWLDSYPYLYGMDEPGPAGFRVVARQARVAHSCFPGSHVLVTGNPSLQNRFLWNGGSDDVDAWVVLASRYYGKYTVPKLSRAGRSNAKARLKLIDQARTNGATIWTYTYPGVGTPSFTASEPLSDPRLLFEWAALEGVGGVLYGVGMTTYTAGNPLVSVTRDGARVLVYPGRNAPIPSARLEQIREGIEDWEILNVVRQKHGAAAVRTILRGLFSTTKSGVTLACTVGCTLHSGTPYSWPRWSHDTTTAAKLEQARLRALTAASR